MHMALVTRDNVVYATGLAAYSNTDIPLNARTCSDDCNRYLGIIEGIVRELSTVTSIRRPYPKGKPTKPNPFVVHKYLAGSGTIYKFCYTPNHHVVMGEGLRWMSDGQLLATPQDLCALHANVTENAVADVYAKANAPAIFDLAPELAELGETLLWLGSLFKAFVDLLKLIAFRKGGLRLVRDIAHGIANPHELWLEYRYAFMPFYLTVGDAIAAYKGGSSKKTIGATCVVKQKRHFDSPAAYYDNTRDTYHKLRVVNHVVDSVKATASLTIKSQCDPSPFGLGAWDTLRAAYEVFPLSFVLNWFLGIEEWLGSLRNTKLEISSSYVTTVVNRKGHITSESSGDINWLNPVDVSYTEFMMRRTPNVVPPVVPRLQAEHLSLLRSVDAIALMVGLIKGCLTRKPQK
jgi:hypothetical protein